jgi:hypothetical protein
MRCGWRFSVFTPYILVGSLLVAIVLVSIVVSRIRKTPTVDQVAPNVLNRIRTEYR